MQKITTDELRQMMDAGAGDFLLVNVLDPPDFRSGHIPGSINIPLSDEDFVARARARTEGPHDRLIVYCSSRRSIASRRAAERLEETGFKNVIHYEMGMEGWMESNLPVGSLRPRRTA